MGFQNEKAPTVGAVGARDDVSDDDWVDSPKHITANGSRSKAENAAERRFNTSLSAEQVINAIASYCGRAERSGKDWKCNCPICGRHSLSLSYGHKISILIRCWHCESIGLNDGYTEQCAKFVEAGLLPPSSRTLKKLTPKEYREYQAAKREEAVRLWERLFPIGSDDPVAKYLRARGLESFIGHSALRGALGHHVPGRLRPVLAARLWHVEFGLCAVQFTYLCFDGSDRDRELEPGRRTYGTRKGGAAWIGAPIPNEEVVVAEGLESLLSAMLLLNLRCGAAVTGPDLKELVLPSGVRSMHIAADNDETGRGAADYTAKIWRGRGLKVRVSMPDKEGDDFNDVLRGQQ
jgi:Toprim domain